MDDDKEMTFVEVNAYVESLVHEYKKLLLLKIKEIEKNNAKVTYRKIKRLKKSTLFNMLRYITNKNKGNNND